MQRTGKEDRGAISDLAPQSSHIEKLFAFICTQDLDADVVLMKPAEDVTDASGPLNGRDRCIF
jgi:hypothetical protein